uniref:RING-type domain-containing protein n=1 Tax=Globodera rostochiensis TaxID=31243 RepID=A0A914HUX2_GLORO
MKREELLEEGLCNGTRVQIRKLGNNILRCKILTGKHRGEKHDLHAARFLFGGDPKAPNKGLIKCERIQFPLRPGSVMTINKSQGQTLTHVGVLLDKSQCFSHGQSYTALSRVRDSANIRVCTKRADRRIRNVVMTELLDKEDLESPPEVDHNDPDDPYPRAPPKDGDSDDDDKPAPPAPPAFKTPTIRQRTSGIAGFPRDVAAKTAFEAILNWLVENPIDAELIDEIRLVPFNKSDAGLYRDVWAQVSGTNLSALSFLFKLKRMLNARRSTSRSSRNSSATTSRASSPATTPRHPKVEAMDSEPCASATVTLPVNAQLYSQLSSSSSVIAWHPPILQHGQGTMDIQQPNTSHCQQSGGRASEATIEGDGNFFGKEVHSNTTAFRQRLFGFLNLLLGNQQLFPRAHFGSRQEFMQRLQRQLIDQGTLEAYAALRLTDRNWAQINDSILVALLLQRPVVVLSPNMSVNDCALLAHVPVAMTLPGLVPAQQQPPAEESITSESGSDCNEGREESVPPPLAHRSGTDVAIEAAKLVIKLNARLLHPLRLEMEQKQQELLAAQAAEAKPMLLSQPNFLKLKRQQRAAIESLQKELNFASEQFQFRLEEARKIEAILKAAVDPAFRFKQKKRLTEFVEETPVAACPPVKQQCCEQIFECADHLYNTAWTFICLWYTLMQIDPHTASLECLADWRKQSGRCSSKLYRLQDAWEDTHPCLKKNWRKPLIRKVASRRPASLPKPTASFSEHSSMLCTKKIAQKKCADASSKRLMQAAECSTKPNSELQKEREDYERRKSADQRMQAKLQRIEQQLKQHIHRQKNLAVRNLMWDREAALEQRIRVRYHTFRAETEQLRQSSIETGDLDNYEHCLATDAAINAFCQKLIDLASQDSNADVDEQIRKHKEVIEREERGLAEQQRWRNFAYEQRDAETAFDRHHNPQAAWGLSDEIRRLNNEHQQTVEALRAQREQEIGVANINKNKNLMSDLNVNTMIKMKGMPNHETPVNDHLQQFSAFMQPDPEAVRAREIIEQRLGPDPHPHFTSLDMRILNRETAYTWHKEQKACEIGREPLLRGDLITELPCHPSAKHVFHTICLRRWLATNRSCPSCRTPVDITPLITPNDAHLQAFNAYVEEESQQATTLRVPDNDLRAYEQLRRGEWDEYGSTIRPPMAPRRALQQVLQRIRGGRFERFGGQQLEWDASDPRNDATEQVRGRKRVHEDSPLADQQNFGTGGSCSSSSSRINSTNRTGNRPGRSVDLDLLLAAPLIDDIQFNGSFGFADADQHSVGVVDGQMPLQDFGGRLEEPNFGAASAGVGSGSNGVGTGWLSAIHPPEPPTVSPPRGSGNRLRLRSPPQRASSVHAQRRLSGMVEHMNITDAQVAREQRNARDRMRRQRRRQQQRRLLSPSPPRQQRAAVITIDSDKDEGVPPVAATAAAAVALPNNNNIDNNGAVIGVENQQLLLAGDARFYDDELWPVEDLVDQGVVEGTPNKVMMMGNAPLPDHDREWLCSTSFVLRSLPSNATGVQLDGDGKRNAICSICREWLLGILLVIRLPCGHFLHRKCFNNEAKLRSGCPLCRRHFLTGQVITH